MQLQHWLPLQQFQHSVDCSAVAAVPPPRRHPALHRCDCLYSIHHYLLAEPGLAHELPPQERQLNLRCRLPEFQVHVNCKAFC